jgi:hypothetical protein
VESETSPEAAIFVSGGRTMNAREFIADYRSLGPQDPHIFPGYLADHLYELRLMTGQRVNDLMDFKLLLCEIAEAWRMAEFPDGTIFPPGRKALV